MFHFNLEQNKETSLFDTTKQWDFIVIGGGPAGLNASLYAKRKGLHVGIISADIGGQLHNTTDVDNYLGFPLIQGKDLSQHFLTHVENLEIPILKDVYVKEIKQIESGFQIQLDNLKTIESKTILIATGGKPRKLEINGEDSFANKGVSYCTICDAPFFKDKHVIVAGGGNSAAEAVIDLVPWANKITVVHRSNWRADDILLEKLKTMKHLEVFLQTQILEVLGEDNMTGIKVLDKTTNQERIIPADGLFIQIGTIPNSSFIKHLVDTNERSEIIVDDQQMTSVQGIFAAGDVTNQPYKQIIIATAEGAKAALAAADYISHQ